LNADAALYWAMHWNSHAIGHFVYRARLEAKNLQSFANRRVARLLASLWSVMDLDAVRHSRRVPYREPKVVGTTQDLA